MKMRIAGTLLFSITCCLSGYAQTWEVGGAGGLGVTRNLTVSNPTTSADVGIKNGVAFSALLSQRLYRHFAGEGRYTFQVGELRLKGNGQEPTLNAESHAMHYDLLVIVTQPKAVVRPFLAVGGGAKIYHSSERPPIFQPLNNLVVLTQTTQAEPMVSVGGGVKFALGRAILRLDVRDYATPLPDKLFAVRAGARLNGWLNNIVFLVGIGYAFHEPSY
jgi:hypothetical protein